jgi:hypothetical protein
MASLDRDGHSFGQDRCDSIPFHDSLGRQIREFAMTFSGKVAFITGGGRGMGQLAARNLAARGVLAAALDVNTSGLAETAAGFDNILTLPADVTEPQAVLDTIESSLDTDELWVFPGRGTKMGWRMRRWFPGLMWKQIHKTEGF